LHRSARYPNKGVVVEAWPAERAAGSGALRDVLAEWLAGRGMPSLSFLADPHVLDAPLDRRVFVAGRGGTPVAYLVLAPIPARDGWHVEWVIRRPPSPNGTAALLLDAAARSVAEADVLTLGLVPLSTHGPLSAPAPGRAVRALLAWTRAHARRFYSFEGLERFKAKFLPDAWEPLYLLTRGPAGLGTFWAVADAFAGEQSPVGLVGRALAGAAADEVRAAVRGLRPE
jgi:phosphatidylglycerol lysyltransferase